MSFLRFACAILLISSVAGSAHAQNNDSENPAWARVLDGSAVAIMRHALAPGTGDPANFAIDECSTQRNLSEIGRTQARAIGSLFRENKIEQARVITSAWCRCLHTAELLDLGEPAIMPALNSFFADRSTAGEQTEQLRIALTEWLTEPSMPTVLVTHQVNISALTSNFTRSGEILIITIENDELVVLASVATLD